MKQPNLRCAAMLLGAILVVTGVACEQPSPSQKDSPARETAVDRTTSTARSAAAPSSQTARPGDASLAPTAVSTVAIGDLHGDIEPLRLILRKTGLVDEKLDWSGGQRTLVQTGDVLDRGADEREIYELLWKLKRQAEDAGGRVVLLNGNHEVMNVLGDFRYVTEAGAADFSEYQLADEPQYDKVPPAIRGRVAAFLPGGTWAKKLSKQPLIARVDRGLFAHGGVHREHLEYGIDRINEEVSDWMMNGGNPPRWATDSDGPLWTRVWSGAGEPDCEQLSAVLRAAEADFMAVGHTPQKGGVVSRCDGALWLIDTGMSSHYGGPTEAIGIGESGDVQTLTVSD